MTKIKLSPSQLMVTSNNIIYASLFDMECEDKKVYDRFINDSHYSKLFSYGNTGTHGISSTHTFDDGRPELEWLVALFAFIRNYNLKINPVELILSKKFMGGVNVNLFNVNIGDMREYGDITSEKIIDSYIFFMKRFANMSGVSINTRAAGREWYRIIPDKKVNSLVIYGVPDIK